MTSIKIHRDNNTQHYETITNLLPYFTFKNYSKTKYFLMEMTDNAKKHVARNLFRLSRQSTDISETKLSALSGIMGDDSKIENISLKERLASIAHSMKKDQENFFNSRILFETKFNAIIDGFKEGFKEIKENKNYEAFVEEFELLTKTFYDFHGKTGGSNDFSNPDSFGFEYLFFTITFVRQFQNLLLRMSEKYFLQIFKFLDIFLFLNEDLYIRDEPLFPAEKIAEFKKKLEKNKVKIASTEGGSVMKIFNSIVDKDAGTLDDFLKAVENCPFNVLANTDDNYGFSSYLKFLSNYQSLISMLMTNGKNLYKKFKSEGRFITENIREETLDDIEKHIQDLDNLFKQRDGPGYLKDIFDEISERNGDSSEYDEYFSSEKKILDLRKKYLNLNNTATYEGNFIIFKECLKKAGTNEIIINSCKERISTGEKKFIECEKDWLSKAPRNLQKFFIGDKKTSTQTEMLKKNCTLIHTKTWG